MEVGGGQTFLASSELMETKLAEALGAGTVYSVQYFSFSHMNILFVQKIARSELTAARAAGSAAQHYCSEQTGASGGQAWRPALSEEQQI